VNRLQRQGLRLIVTGSNAHLLSSELATHLTGRHIPIILFPFSYDEYLRWHNKEMTTVEMAEQLQVYAQSGGFPEPIVKSVSRQDYLTTLLHSILYKDIVSRYGIRAVQGLENLATYLIANAAQEYSLKTLSTVSHCKSVHTVEKFLLYLERAFLFFHIQRFSYKIRQQSRSPRKIYCIDNGWVTSSSFRISADRGKLWENLVAIALKKRSLSENVEIFFWKSARGEEVDFVVKKGLIIEQLIQVCCDPSHPKTREREIRALLKASAELHCDDLMVLTENEETQEQVSWYGHSGLVRFVPLWKWLTVK